MSKRITIAGYGPVGRALAERLSLRGDRVKIVQRQAPVRLPANADFVRADLKLLDEARQALAAADVVVCAVGVPYVSKIYMHLWPVLMRNLLDVCSSSGARFVFADNLYMYGPQTRPLAEDMTLTQYGQKPRVRAEITRMWQEAHARGDLRAVAVRASDFYGPDVPTSVLSTLGVARLIAGKPALAPYPPDKPHDFTYVPDFARALESLIGAPDNAYGQAWHVPNAPTRSLRELFNLASALVGTRPRVTVLPRLFAPIFQLFSGDLRELKEMRFQWDRPYCVDASKFSRRFWSDPTPFEKGLKETVEFYRGQRQKHARGGASG